MAQVRQAVAALPMGQRQVVTLVDLEGLTYAEGANSAGLGLFREEVSTQVERIRRLSEQYDNIHFIACQNTMEVPERQGVRTRLLTGTRTTQSAVDHIIERLQDGWVYVRA